MLLQSLKMNKKKQSLTNLKFQINSKQEDQKVEKKQQDLRQLLKQLKLENQNLIRRANKIWIHLKMELIEKVKMISLQQEQS